jgi:hypothetical protein
LATYGGSFMFVKRIRPSGTRLKPPIARFIPTQAQIDLPIIYLWTFKNIG